MDGFDKLFLFFIVGCIIKYACGYKKRILRDAEKIRKYEMDKIEEKKRNAKFELLCQKQKRKDQQRKSLFIVENPHLY